MIQKCIEPFQMFNHKDKKWQIHFKILWHGNVRMILCLWYIRQHVVSLNMRNTDCVLSFSVLLFLFLQTLQRVIKKWVRLISCVS